MYSIQFLNKITNIGKFYTFSDTLYCFYTDGYIKKFNNLKTMWKSIFHTQYFVANFNDKLFCTWRDYDNIIFFDYKSGSIIKEKEIKQFRVLNVKNGLILGLYYTALDLENNTYKFCVGQIDEKFEFNILFETKDSAPFLFLDKYLLGIKSNNILTCHPLSSGEEKWRLNFDALLGIAETRLYGDILEDKGRLFFFLSEVQAGVGTTFCVSLETGEVLQKIEGFGGWLQLVDGQLYVLGRKELKILNPDTFEKIVVDFSAILDLHDWQFTWNKYVVKDHYLYFINENVGGGGTATVGILDIRTQDLVWYTDIEIEAGKYWIAEIRVQDNRLYVLTQGGTLYVYEYEGV